ncbi:hypothetical protein SDC9_198117 [bioreactor metagenome]|uniref:Uncharacterized protein n=1 Tax=bioreactor metagenome TaxID=1076179 RepID=A0A645IH98_9ZZZZ
MHAVDDLLALAGEIERRYFILRRTEQIKRTLHRGEKFAGHLIDKL